MPRKAAPSKKASTASKIPLTTWERIELVGSVIAAGRGVRDMLRASVLRKNIVITPEERERFSITEPQKGTFHWPTSLTTPMLASDTEMPVSMNEADLEYIQNCFKLLLSEKLIKASPEWTALTMKFFSEEELLELADEIEPEAAA